VILNNSELLLTWSMLHILHCSLDQIATFDILALFLIRCFISF
jgi:hypothetical protein